MSEDRSSPLRVLASFFLASRSAAAFHSSSLGVNSAHMTLRHPSVVFMAKVALERPRIPPKVSRKPRTKYEPPKPPAPPGLRGGGGGGGGDWPKYLKLLDRMEQAAVLKDWVSQTGIFRMSGSFGNPELARRHTRALETLDALQRFTPSTSLGHGREVLLALTDTDGDILAVAGADVSFTETESLDIDRALVVSRLAVKPVEVHKKDSSVGQSMVHAIRSAAYAIQVRLEMAPLQAVGELPLPPEAE